MSEELRKAIEEMEQKGAKLEQSIVALTEQVAALVRDLRQEQQTRDVLDEIIRGAR